MTDYGVTPEGFVRKTYEVARARIASEYRRTISNKLDTDSPEAHATNLINPYATAEAELWELAEAVYHGLDVNSATEESAVFLASLVGVTRRQPDYGHVSATVSIATDRVFAAGGLVAMVDGQPANRWVLVTPIDTTGVGSTEDYTVEFKSEGTGSSYYAPASTLRIAEPRSGWISITNASDADPGTDLESPEALMIRRGQEMAASGSATAAAIRSAVAKVDGVEQVVLFANPTSEPVDGIPAHSHRVVIYDGSPAQASNDAVAQAIQDTQADGVRSFGLVTGNTIDELGLADEQYFDRATNVDLTCAIEVISASGYSEDAIKAAASGFVTGVIGADVVYLKLVQAVLGVAGVDDLASLTLNGGTTNIAIAADERASLDTSDISVS